MKPQNITFTLKKMNLNSEKITFILDVYKKIKKRIKVIENNKTNNYVVTRNGIGPIETDFGTFWCYNFVVNDKWKEYFCLIKCGKFEKGYPIFKNNEVFLRIDSGCKTSHLFGDKTCECSEQLKMSMKIISELQEGIIIHIPEQDGRGQGIRFKLATLTIQKYLGIDTYESAKIVAAKKDIDIRTYSGSIAILKFLKIKNKVINIATNNPKKISVFSTNSNGLNLGSRIPIIIKPTNLTLSHLIAKEKKMGHLGLVR